MTPSIAGQQFTNEEKLELFDQYSDVLNKRRSIKDVLAVMNVFIENIEQTRNFILGMNRRQYSAKSQKFSGDSDYHYGAKDTTDMAGVRYREPSDSKNKQPTMVSVHVQ